MVVESNIHLAGRKFAQEASWPTTETGLSLQTTGGQPQDRSTKVCEPKLLMFGMDPITADLGPAVVSYDDKVVGEQIRRPQGQVDQEITGLVSHIDPGPNPDPAPGTVERTT